MNRKTKQIILPLLAAMIWGSAFVAQKDGAELLGPLTFNWTRSLIAVAALLPLVLLVRRRAGGREAAQQARDRRELLKGGLTTGTLLALAMFLQQYGVGQTTAGKAGFLTALYIVLVPVFGVFLGKRVSPQTAGGVAVAVAGLYFLSFTAGGVPDFSRGDVYVLACAFVFALQILAVDHFVRSVDGILLSWAQFAFAAAESLLCALAFEGFPAQAIVQSLPYILYAGILSSGVGYTLQIIAQKDGDPTVVSLLLSLESFFAVVSGALFLHERLSAREYFGCALMLCAVVLVQLPEKKKRQLPN